MYQGIRWNTSSLGSKGWRSGDSSRLPPMLPGFKSRRRRHIMWVEFVVGSLLCSERFFSGYFGFPLPSKTSISKFQFDQESGRRRTICGCATSKSLFIHLFIYYLLLVGVWIPSLYLIFYFSVLGFQIKYSSCLINHFSVYGYWMKHHMPHVWHIWLSAKMKQTVKGKNQRKKLSQRNTF